MDCKISVTFQERVGNLSDRLAGLQDRHSIHHHLSQPLRGIGVKWWRHITRSMMTFYLINDDILSYQWRHFKTDQLRHFILLMDTFYYINIDILSDQLQNFIWSISTFCLINNWHFIRSMARFYLIYIDILSDQWRHFTWTLAKFCLIIPTILYEQCRNVTWF